jgi:molybdopterin biosynthesis enzyme
MRGFAHRHTVEAALVGLNAQLQSPHAEVVRMRMTAGRMLTTLVVSDAYVPGFDRPAGDPHLGG